MHHGSGKRLRILLTGKVQPVNGLGIAPLVEGRRRLVVFQALQNRAVDHDLMVLQLPANHSEGVVRLVVVDLHLTQPGRCTRWNPLFLDVIVDHHRCTGPDDTLLTETRPKGRIITAFA